jgi:hypothetical protein
MTKTKRSNVQYHGYASFVVISIRTFLHSLLVTWSVIKVIWRVSLLEQELLTIPDHLCFPRDFDFLCVAQSLGFCVVFCRSLYVWPFCFGHCIVCPFSSCCYLFRIFNRWLCTFFSILSFKNTCFWKPMQIQQSWQRLIQPQVSNCEIILAVFLNKYRRKTNTNIYTA